MTEEAAPTDRAEGFDRAAIGVRVDQSVAGPASLATSERRSSGPRTAWWALLPW